MKSIILKIYNDALASTKLKALELQLRINRLESYIEWRRVDEIMPAENSEGWSPDVEMAYRYNDQFEDADTWSCTARTHKGQWELDINEHKRETFHLYYVAAFWRPIAKLPKYNK